MRNIRAAALVILALCFSEAARGESAVPVEVKPHPCKPAWSDREVLCATYPVWENRDTKQGRKIGLNVVILPALGPDKLPDPVFEIAGGPGQAIAEVGEYAGVDSRKRDVVLVDQRGTGKSNPLFCDLYGDPVDFRRAAGDLFSAGAHGGGGECRVRMINGLLDRGSVQGIETACAASESAPTRFTVAAPEGAVAAAEVKPYPCRVPDLNQDVLCASYPVWENRETKQGRKIGLNIVILPAADPDKEPDPIFELGGGPGQGIAGNAAGYAGGPLNRRRDIVLVDQRGTGKSNPLHCSFYGEPLDLRLAAGELFPIDAVKKCREKLEKVADLTQYTTAAFADDLDEVRRWLGYDKINLEGGSYGTRSAQVYWRRHPEAVRSVVLMGTTGLDVYLPIEHAAAGQRALDLLLADCAAQPECRAAYPDTAADLKAVRERIEKGVTVTVANPVTGERQEVRPTWGLVAEGMRFLMYGRAGADLPLQLRKAARGDLEPLVQMAIERRLGIADGLELGLNFSVSCAEDLPFITEDMIAPKIAGTYLGDYRIRQQKAVCEVWPRGRIAADTHDPVRSGVPVLLISGERDPVTPPALAERASRFMTNHLHVIVPRAGHGVDGDCMIGVVGEFIDRAAVQGLDTACAADVYGPTPFTKP